MGRQDGRGGQFSIASFIGDLPLTVSLHAWLPRARVKRRSKYLSCDTHAVRCPGLALATALDAPLSPLRICGVGVKQKLERIREGTPRPCARLARAWPQPKYRTENRPLQMIVPKFLFRLPVSHAALRHGASGH